MSPERNFLDTNIPLYAFAVADDHRSAMAETLVVGHGQISVQVLNEFVAVTSRKLKMPWQQILAALNAIRDLCGEPLPITAQVHDAGVAIAMQHGYHIYDSLIIASALQSGCNTLYSEDMHDGQRIETVTIRNPFSAR